VSLREMPRVTVRDYRASDLTEREAAIHLSDDFILEDQETHPICLYTLCSMFAMLVVMLVEMRSLCSASNAMISKRRC
jgi:hypothetical protein